MGGILRWLDNFFTNAASSTVDAYLSIVHWAIRGLTALIFGQFNNTNSAWNVYYTDNKYFITQIEIFSRNSKNAHGYTLRFRIPQVIHWALGNFGRLAAAILALTRALAHDVAMILAFIRTTARALTIWVLRHVWAPLYAYARKIYADLLKWGYVAWWWITHLDRLAEAMIFHIAMSMERNAWRLAGMLGRFVLALVLHNARRLAILVEHIVTAVI